MIWRQTSGWLGATREITWPSAKRLNEGLLHCVQGFLTAVKQEVNRRHAADKWALDDVVMTAEVLHPAREVDQIREGPQEGVYIYGLFLDGCAWSNKDGKLVDSEPKKLYHPLPVIFVTGVQVRPSFLGRPVLQGRSKVLFRLFFWGICSLLHGL